MIQGFKEFISRGNVVELAVGVIIGAAFGEVVSAVVDKFINPLIGAIFGHPNFDTVMQFQINGATIQPGTVITALVQFLIVSGAIYFFIVVPVNKLAALRKAEETEPEAPSDEVRLLTEIRDALATTR
ncbi:MAG: large conductance mechanosensitive channel protein MscL [Bowdeniella nasicola]|nr:large conductance mechanosensitive channel protein MscL [Bowdeniella nasicola]